MLHRIPGIIRKLGTAAGLNFGTSPSNVVQLQDDGAGNGQLPAIDGSLLTGITTSVSADLELTIAEMALSIADTANVAQFLGGDGNRVADSFDALTYVDTAGATNLDTSVAGLLKPLNSRITTATPSTPLGGSPANINDNTATTVSTTSALGNLSASAVSARIFAKLDLGSILTVSKIEAIGLSCSSAASVGNGEGLYYSEDDIIWTEALAFTITTSPQNVTATGSFRARYVAVVASQENWATITHTVKDLNAYTSSSIIVASTAFTASSAPISAKLVASVNETSTITPNTDLIFYASRDGGTYTAFTMTKKFTIGSVSIYESDQLDITTQPSGTSMKWKITSANGVIFEIQGVYFYWKYI